MVGHVYYIIPRYTKYSIYICRSNANWNTKGWAIWMEYVWEVRIGKKNEYSRWVIMGVKSNPSRTKPASSWLFVARVLGAHMWLPGASGYLLLISGPYFLLQLPCSCNRYGGLQTSWQNDVALLDCFSLCLHESLGNFHVENAVIFHVVSLRMPGHVSSISTAPTTIFHVNMGPVFWKSKTDQNLLTGIVSF